MFPAVVKGHDAARGSGRAVFETDTGRVDRVLSRQEVFKRFVCGWGWGTLTTPDPTRHENQ